jgi:4-hydroxybenzoate polyprenyltransferase
VAKILTLSLNDLSTKALGRRVEHMRDDPSIPLCVKLEGAVLRNGTTGEIALSLVRRNPLMLFVLLRWLFLGADEFRERVNQNAAFNPAGLPYRRPFLVFLHREIAAGRNIILIARSGTGVTRAIANHLGLFSEIIQIDPDSSPEITAKRLCARFGTGDFDFAGSGPADIAVWRTARRAVIVAPSPRLLKHRIWNSQAADILCPDDHGTGRYISAVRPGRWIKNLLIFLPLLDVANRGSAHFTVTAYLAFCAYCMIASAGYVANDLADLVADRRHASKRRRVLASGRLSIKGSVILLCGLLVAGFGMSFLLSPLLAGWMAVYLALSLSYSFWIKKTLIIDTFVITALYMHRILTGCILAATAPSLLEILFAGFFFFGLAMLGRYGELQAGRLSAGRNHTRAIGYRRGDLDLVASFGLAGGYLSALILVFYTLTPEAQALFRSPIALWNLLPLQIYWVSRVWVFARRGRIPDDPVLFALEDRVSLYIALATVVIVLTAIFARLPFYTLI